MVWVVKFEGMELVFILLDIDYFSEFVLYIIVFMLINMGYDSKYVFCEYVICEYVLYVNEFVILFDDFYICLYKSNFKWVLKFVCICC